MSDIPKFNFKSSLKEEDVQKQELESTKKDPKMFKPGTYDLKIVSAEYDKPMSGDATWHGYKVRLGLDTRSVSNYVIIPTQSPDYKKPGMDPKHRMIMFHKFRDFVRALGEDASVDALNKTINKLFADPSALVGRVVKVDIGYKGPHTEFVEKGLYKLVDKAGKELSPETFSDRDAVKAYAASLGLMLNDFPEVTKLHKAEAKKKEQEPTDPWGE